MKRLGVDIDFLDLSKKNEIGFIADSGFKGFICHVGNGVYKALTMQREGEEINECLKKIITYYPKSYKLNNIQKLILTTNCSNIYVFEYRDQLFKWLSE